MKNNPVTAFESKVLAAIKAIDASNSNINLSGLGNNVPTGNVTWSFWFKPTASIVRTVGSDRYLFQTYDIYLYDGIANSATLANLTGLLADFETYETAYDFSFDSEGAYELVATKGYVKRSYIIKTLVVTEGVDPSCNVLIVEGPAGADGHIGVDGANGAAGVDGKSAYQVWLDLGNTGTPTDFINSLHIANSIPWTGVTSTPTTLAGYGITDALNLTTGDARYVPIAQTATTFISPANNTLLKIDLTNTNNGRSQATRQLVLTAKDGSGNELQPVDSTTFQQTAMLLLKQKRDTGSDNPMYIACTIPEFGKPNGRVWWVNNASGGVTGRFRDVTRSTFDTTGQMQGTGLEQISLSEEFTSSLGVQTVGMRFVAMRVNPAQSARFFSFAGAVFANYKSIAFEFANTAPDVFSGNYIDSFSAYAGWLMRMRPYGDVHFNGAFYTSFKSFAADDSLALNKDVYVYTGSGNTLTLPDPTDADNIGRTHKIVNMGAGDLTLSRVVYLDGTTTQTIVTYTHPSNKLSIICDGTKWMAIA